MANDRLELLMKQSEPQYAQGSPILLEACALYYDRPNNNCIAQIKWKNIDTRAIKAVNIELLLFDAFDQQIKSVSHQYNKINISKGAFFGEKDAIVINEPAAIRYDVILNAVSFTDGSVYRSDGKNKFETLPSKKPVSVSKEFFDQYKRDLAKNGYSLASCCQPQQKDELWQCGCGSWQHVGTSCLNCGATQEILEQIANPQQLKANLVLYQMELAEEERILEEKRIAQEKANEERRKAEEERRLAQEKINRDNAVKEAAQKKKKKTIAIFIAALMAIAVGIACVFNFYVIPNGHYNKGKTLASSQQWDEAVAEFEAAGGYNNSETQILATRYKEGEAKRAVKDWDGAVIAFQLAGDYQDASEQIFRTRYEEGNDKSASNDTEGAAQAYLLAGNYSDAPDKYCRMMYLTGVNYYNEGDYLLAKKAFNSIKHYDNSAEYITTIDNMYSDRFAFADSSVFAVKDDGTVVVVVDPSNSYYTYREERDEAVKWTNVSKIVCVNGLIVALTKDGYVLSAGSSPYIKSDVLSKWSNIKSIHPQIYHLVGIKNDGTVVAAGNSHDSYGDVLKVKSWDHIIDVAGNSYSLIGVKNDSSLVQAGDFFKGLENEWNNIDKIKVSHGNAYCVGLKNDGTVITRGGSYNDIDEADKWTDIVDIDIAGYRVLGLRKDGTVVAAGSNENGALNVADWHDIVSVCCFGYYSAGIRSDGTVVIAGKADSWHSDEWDERLKKNVGQWTDIVALCSDGYTYLGIKKDGSVISAEDNSVLCHLR